jgi:hypothetical protein
MQTPQAQLLPEPPKAEELPELNEAPDGTNLTDEEMAERAANEARQRAASMSGREGTILTPSDMGEAPIDEPSLTKQKKRTTLLDV